MELIVYLSGEIHTKWRNEITEKCKNGPELAIVEDVISRISLKRIADPKEIANTVLLLSSELSSYITGQNIRVDGGM